MTRKKPDPKNDDSRIDFLNVSTKFLAEVLGVTPDAVTKLYRAGVFKQNGKARGKYSLTEAVPAYIQSVQSSGAAQAGERLKVQQERKLKLANDAAERNLIKIDEAAELFQVVCAELKNAISAIPRRASTQIRNAKSAAACRKVLEKEYAEAIEEFEKPLREYYGVSWDSLTRRK